MNELRYYRKRTRLVVLSCLGIIGVAIGLYLIGRNMSGGSVEAIILGFLLALLFGGIAIHNMKVLLSNAPALMIDEEGIHDNSTYMSGGLIKWEDIESAGIGQFQGWLFLVIYTQDPELITKRFGGVKKLLVQFNKGLSDAQVHIPFRLLACEPLELAEAVGSRLEQHVVNN